MMDNLHRRVRQIRSRALVRSWDYRQRRLARGVWFRLRRLLADASDAYCISEDDAERLAAEGYQPEPVGAEVDPPRRIFFVPPTRISGLASARPLAVRLDAALLAAQCLALVRFPLDTREEPGPAAR